MQFKIGNALVPFVGLFLASCLTRAARGEEKVIGFIDTYGLSNVPSETVLKGFGFKPGDPVPEADARKELARKLGAIPGVKRAAVHVIYGGLLAGNAPGHVVYIGIDEGSRPEPVYHAAPTSETGLPGEIVSAYEDFERARVEAMRRGNFSSEDSRRGYYLLGDADARTYQEKLIALADPFSAQLGEVLRTAASAEQRAMAASMIGYLSDKRAAARELAFAARDPDAGVRNDAIRGLSALAGYARRHRELAIEIPVDRFIEMLDSFAWTDRNKSLAVLLELSNGDEAVIAKLRQRSLPTLIEMARWQAAGHAMMSLILVGRIAGMPDEEVAKAWFAGARESVIQRAMNSRSAEAQD